MSDPTVFPFPGNDGGIALDSMAYSTDIIVGNDRTEQRIAQRGLPLGQVQFSVVGLDPAVTAQMMQLLWAGHRDLWRVPLWPYALSTTAVLYGGERIIPCAMPAGVASFADIPWQTDPDLGGGAFLLWASANQWEVHRFDAIDATLGWGLGWGQSWGVAVPNVPAAIGTPDAAQGDSTGWGLNWGNSWGVGVVGTGTWPIGSLVVPLRLCRLDPRLRGSVESGDIESAGLTWLIDGPDSPGTFNEQPRVAPTYLGTDVLEVELQNDSAMPTGHESPVNVLDSKTGPRTLEVLNQLAPSLRTLELTAFDLGAAAVIRRFVQARRGRQRRFWAPSWQRDFVHSSAAGSGSSTITVLGWGYATGVFPLGNARRHIRLRSPSGQLYYRRVTAAVHNLDGTETLTLQGPNGETSLGVASDSTWQVSFMRMGRLDSDEISFAWDGGVMSTVLPFRELTQEVAA